MLTWHKLMLSRTGALLMDKQDSENIQNEGNYILWWQCGIMGEINVRVQYCPHGHQIVLVEYGLCSWERDVTSEMQCGCRSHTWSWSELLAGDMRCYSTHSILAWNYIQLPTLHSWIFKHWLPTNQNSHIYPNDHHHTAYVSQHSITMPSPYNNKSFLKILLI